MSHAMTLAKDLAAQTHRLIDALGTLQEENARLRQQRDAANAQIQFLMELLNEGTRNT